MCIRDSAEDALMRTEAGPIAIPVSGIKCFGKRNFELLVRDNATFFNDVTNVFFQTSSRSLGPPLLPRALRVNEVMQCAVFTNVRAKLMSNEFWTLICDDQLWPTIVFDPQSSKSFLD